MILLTNLIYLFDYDFRNERQVLETLRGGSRCLCRFCRQMVTVIRWVTDTIRSHSDYGRRLHTDLPQRLVRMRRGRRFPRKTPIGQSVCLTPSLYMEFEPSRHNPFVRPTGAKMGLPPIIPHAPYAATPAYLLFRGIAWPFLAEITPGVVQADR